MPKYTRDQLQRFVNEIRLQGTNVTNFERHFVSGVAAQLEQRGVVTSSHMDQLARIHEQRVVPS